MLTGKKELLGDLLSTFRAFDLLGALRANALFVVNYHRLYSGVLKTAYDKDVFEYSVDMFDHHLKWLKMNFDVIGEQDVIEIYKTKRITGRKVLVTFDDGYIDNYTLAFPVLKHHGMPAVFFIPTEAIMTRQVGWWDIISFIINRTEKKEISIGDVVFTIGTPVERKKAVKYAIHLFKSTAFDNYKDLINNLSDDSDIAIPDCNEQGSQLMTWEQIKDVMRHGIDIGSHTHSHRVLSTLDEKEQFLELSSSKSLLESQLGQTISSVSYPVGGYDHFSALTKELSKEAGYKLGFSYNTGYNQNCLDCFDIKRFSLSAHEGFMKGQLFLPSVFCKS